MSVDRAITENNVQDFAQRQFLENLRWARGVVASWTAEEKVYNSIGYPSDLSNEEMERFGELDGDCDE